MRDSAAADVAAVLCLVLAQLCWFGAWPATWPAGPALLAALALALVPRRHALRPARPHPETLLCLGLALAYRATALVHPWGWVNRDGAYGAFVALHLLRGLRPAPVFTEGANYQGTLKGHLAALLHLVTRDGDSSRLIALAGVLLSLVFVAATMALARRVGGRGAALVAGLYLALGPRFPTVFTLNCVGQYADVLALGGLALALLARILDRDAHGRDARAAYFGLGLLLGAAFWQQPVALCYALAAAAVLLLRRRTWTDGWTLAVPLGAAVGALPVLLWNLRHGWASGQIMGRDAGDLAAQAASVPDTIGRTFAISFPILAGLSPGHPLAGWWMARAVALLVVPAALLAVLLLRGQLLRRSLREGRPAVLWLPLLTMAACLALFWAVAAGRVHWRPRYLLPVVAATAVHLGVAAAALPRRWRPAAAAALIVVLALNLAGFLPRVGEAAEAQRHFEDLVRAIDGMGVRAGYADFSLSAPLTMFTGERIVISPRLGPTPAYTSQWQEEEILRRGHPAFLLRPRDDADAFAAVLQSLGVSYRLDREPVPVFRDLSRPVTVEEVLAAWGRGDEAEGGPE